MSRNCNALFQTWRILNVYRHVKSVTSNNSRNFQRKIFTVPLRKHEGNMKFLSGSSSIHRTATSTKLKEIPPVNAHITKYNIKKLMEGLKIENEKSEKGLELLKMCRYADRLNVKVRETLVKEIWHILTESKSATDKHCEEYLLCKLKFRSHITPQLFLSELIKCNIFINYEILHLLLQCSCNHGLVPDMDFILLTMDEMKYPIKEDIQRLLMLGKAKAGEMDEVFKIFEELQLVEDVASCETYVTLLKAIACTGDQNLLTKYYSKALDNEITITEDDVLSILETLIYNHHFDLISNVLEWKSKFHEEDFKRFLLRLISHSHCEIAAVLLPTISEMTEDEGFVQSFLKRIIQADVPFDDVLSVCNLFTEKKASEIAFLSATHFYLLNRNIDKSLSMFQILLDKGFPVRHHYFWPLIIHSSKKDGIEGLSRILKEMRKYKMECDEATLINYILPQIKNLDPRSIVDKIRHETDWTYGSFFESIVHFFLNQSNLYAVHQLISDNKERISSILSLPTFTKRLALKIKRTNIQLAAEILALLPPTSFSDFVVALSRSITDIELFVTIIEELNKNHFGISRETYHYIIESTLKNRSDITSEQLDELAPKLLRLVGTKSEKRIERNLPDAVHWQERLGRNRAKEYFEGLLLEKESKNEDPSFVLCNLLSIYIQSGSYEKAVEIKDKAQKLSVNLTPGIKSKLLQLSIDMKDLKSSISYYKEILSEHPGFKIDDFKIVLLSSLLVENRLLDEALQVLEAAPKSRSRPSDLHSQVMELLGVVAKYENRESYQKFVESLAKKNYTVLDVKSFYPQMIWYLQKDKIKEACNLFSYCVKNYKVAPAPGQLLVRIIEECETDVLLRILRLYGTVCSKLQVRTITSFAYAETGRVAELKNYLRENPVEFLQNNTYAQKTIDFCVRNGRSTELETLFFSLYPSQEAEEFIPFIFKSYTFSKDNDRPLKFLAKITENNIQFPEKYGRYLASVIKLEKEVQ